MNKSLDPETNVLRTLFVDASPAAVWKALTEPRLAHLYMGATPLFELKPDGPVRWMEHLENGEQRLAAKGKMLAVSPGERLRYTTFSVNSDLPDEPASYTTVDLHLVPEGEDRTRVELWQGDFAGLPLAVRRAREAGRKWVEQLVGLKRTAEEQQHALAA